MKNYIEQTKFAAQSLIELISSDFNELDQAKSELIKITAEFDYKHQSFIVNEFHPLANYYHAQAAKAYQKKKEPEAQVKSLSDKIDAKSASISALSGALLQIAKQGLSIKFGRPQNAPKGDKICGLLVKDIIWEGRNQSIHYEHPKEISKVVVKIFSQIDKIRKDDISWDPKSRVNYAFDVVKFLGWLDYNQYENHLKSFKKQ